MKYFLFAVLFLIVLMFISCKDKPSAPIYDNPYDPLYILGDNTPPVAVLTVSTTDSMTFTFDASGSYDNDAAGISLAFRWDWENDGVWDVQWISKSTRTYVYNGAGAYTVVLQVKGIQSLMHLIRKSITITKSAPARDIDGNNYQIVRIGNQWWMAENLKVTHYRNGDAIPNVTGTSEWANLTTGAYCNYENKETRVSSYGRLYNWYAVKDSRNIAPTGWHVPSEAEWHTLIDYLGGDSVAGYKMRSTGEWFVPPFENGKSTNESGFSALGSGERFSTGEFHNYYFFTGFWSSTEYNSQRAYCVDLSHPPSSGVGQANCLNNSGYSIRCLMDKTDIE